MTEARLTERVTVVTQGLEGVTPACQAQLAAVMGRFGQFLGYYPDAQAHVVVSRDAATAEFVFRIGLRVPEACSS